MWTVLKAQKLGEWKTWKVDWKFTRQSKKYTFLYYLHRIKKLTTEVKVMENDLDMSRARKDAEEKKREQPHRLSKFLFEEEEIDINLSQELSGNLRNITVQGSILSDRYKCMQKRNIISPSKDLGLRKRRAVKRYVRNSHKEDPVQPTKSKKKRNLNRFSNAFTHFLMFL